MTLGRVVDAVGAYLAAEAPSTTTVGGAVPATGGDLPAAVLSIDDVTHQLTAVGAIPTPTRAGALPITQDFDLADPTVTFPDGETVDLLAPDRLSLHFPFGPVVAADGTEVGFLAPADLVVTVDGGPLDVVAGDPAPGQVRGNPVLGEITFGGALPATGTLHIDFFIGEWEVETARYQGELVVDVVAGNNAAALATSTEVEAALRRANPMTLPGLRALRPASLGAVSATDEPTASSRKRTLVYQFDFEVEDPILGTGGGLIATVAVDSTFGPEQFDVTREGSSP